MRSPLAHARAEVTALGRLFPDSRILIGDEADEDTVKALLPKARILHFATHAFSHEGDPLFLSGLQVAAGDGKSSDSDGILSGYEILEQDLSNVELVFLSACETARSHRLWNGGYYGLESAFRAAGAQAVVGSLWEVDDAACQELVGYFYDAYLGGHSIPESLAMAQREVRKTRPHPVDWAGWVVVGGGPKRSDEADPQRPAFSIEARAGSDN